MGSWSLSVIFYFSNWWFSVLESKIPEFFKFPKYWKTDVTLFGQHLIRARSKSENFRLYALYLCYFSICCLAAPRPTFGCPWWNSLAYSMLITAFGLSVFNPEVTARSLVSTPNWVPSGFCLQAITHLAITPNYRKYSSQNCTQYSGNMKVPQIPKTVIAWNCTKL